MNLRNLFGNKLHKPQETESGEGTGGSTTTSESSGTQADGFDDYGYPVAKPESATPPVQGGDPAKPAEAPAKPAEGTAKPLEGYGDVEPEVKTPPPPPPPPPEPVKLDFELDTKGIPDAEKQQLLTTIKEAGLDEKASKAMVAYRAAQVAADTAAAEKAKADQKAFVEQTRQGWYRELKSDPNFGGDKFAHNVMMATKVVEDFMPNTKKMLTERNSMLPPYVMRDLAKLGETLLSSPGMPQGNPTVPQTEESPDDHLSFYGS